MKRIYILIIFSMFINGVFYAHDPLIHKYITQQGWLLVKNQYSSVQFSAMDGRVGEWWLGNWDGTGPWQIGKIVTGAKREDEEDVMYWYSQFGNATSTHFWDPTDFSCDQDPDNTKIPIVTYCYENSYVKAKNYWRGKKFANDDWLVIAVPVLSGPNISSPNYYRLFLRYDDLANVYKYNQIYVTHLTPNSFPPIPQITYDPPRPLMDFELQGGTRGRIENIVWEIVGRICHLIGDAGVPAHTHNDIHTFGSDADSFEEYMIDDGQFQSYDWQDAKLQSSIDRLGSDVVTPFSSSDPLKFFIYTTNQIADRFPTMECDGDEDYTHADFGGQYWRYVTPYIANINELSVPYRSRPVTDIVNQRTAEYAFLYSIRSVGGFLWHVFNRFGISITPPPVISSLVQSPPALCPGSYSTITCNLSQGGNNTYSWSYQHKPNNVTATFNGNTATLYRNNGSPGASPSSETFGITCVVSNQYGSTSKTIEPFLPLNCSGGGCPWLYVYNSDSSSYIADNNLLHRSEFSDFVGTNIQDLYKLQVKPSFYNENKCSLIIKETEQDTNYYNSIKLYAVDHPIGTEIGITENNDIVMYDNSSVESTDDANLNGNQNITDLIQYYYQGKKVVSGNQNDSLFAHFNEATQMKRLTNYKNKYSYLFAKGTIDSLALIGEVGYDTRLPINPAVKDYAGYISINTANDNYQKVFARRENLSKTIIPFSNSGDVISTIDVNWYRDFQLSYFSVVPIIYNGFQITEMPLIEAEHSLIGDQIIDLLLDDTNYVKLDSSAILKLKFDNIDEPSSGMIRDYVIYAQGRYSGTLTSGFVNKGSDNPKKIDKLYENQPVKYELHSNFPNPFNPKTIIKYDIPKNSFVKIVIYDVLGRVVDVLVNNFKTRGEHEVAFDGTKLASGIYIYRMESANFVESKRMVLIK